MDNWIPPRVFIGLAFWLFVSAGHVQAHGLELNVLPGQPGVMALYSDGSPMAFAEVTVFAPDSEHPFQLGQTDREGSFTFRPTIDGTWRIEVNDGMGHAVSEHVEIVSGSQLSPRSSQSLLESSSLSRAALGVGLILSFWGSWGLVFANRRRRGYAPK